MHLILRMLKNVIALKKILDKYNIKPTVGIILDNKNKILLKYNEDDLFWNKVLNCQKKDWIIAMPGYQHLYLTTDGGINPIQKRSEFASLSLNEQKAKIKTGYELLINHSIKPTMFFAPSHTFDSNTIEALKVETTIRIISDTIANDIYYDNDFYFIPQQSGKVIENPS